MNIELSEIEKIKNRNDKFKLLIFVSTFSPIPLLFLWINSTLASASFIYSLSDIVKAILLNGLTGLSIIGEIISIIEICRKKRQRFWLITPIVYLGLALICILLYWNAAGAMAM